MSIADLADGLRSADPDRYAMAALAPVGARDRLVTLYALNLELARTPLQSNEPLIAEMRVQWWVDRLRAMADAPPPPHELLTPIHDAWGGEAALLAVLAEGRRRDAGREPFDTAHDVADYVAGTQGALMRLAARASGIDADIAAKQGLGAGIATWLRAQPTLQQIGLGLRDPSPEHLAEIARLGQAAFRDAARQRRQAGKASVLYPGPGAGATLRAVAQGKPIPPISDFARKGGLARLAITGRWWVNP
ncbi:MAG: hypothetical protein DI498_11475 [Paracoccus denitrificans]|nr:MAG: hypothetical protein DI498_11475 [Paracoccus denitrificans]PZO83481.1 MAG: hypothetical protein DI633_11475 [Paracoccus denitrificans]